MKYIDTNVLVRIITGDAPVVAKQVMAKIESGARNEFCIVDAIFVELCFVLEFHNYAMARSDIAEAIEVLVATPQISVSYDTLAALKLYKKYPVLDYADCLLFVLGGKDGVFTLDGNLQKTVLR